jgi:uncharacterized protein
MKLVFAEDGSATAVDAWNRAEVVCSSRLVYPEARAAAAAAYRAGRVDAGGMRAAVERIDSLYDELRRLALDAALARNAGDLAEAHALRGYDAVHLASAISIADPGLVVATWDRQLATAALRVGFAVMPPTA